MTTHIGDADAQTFDITARKFHQTACVLVLAVAFVLGGAVGTVLVGLIGVVMLGGRFWWPLDIFRQLVWRVLEPAGILRRREVHEDHATRRIARILGGIIFLVSALGLAVGVQWSWVAVAAIGLMIALDAAFDFCALCFLTYRVGRLTARSS
jgi:polyferredoxin